MPLININATAEFRTDQVVIAISKSHYDGGHIGLGFHSVKSGPQVLHLAWHQKLCVHSIPDELEASWFVEVLSIPPSASKQLVSLIRAVATRLPKINYGINFMVTRGAFDANGNYKLPKNGDGLTCATFILEVLRAGMVRLLKEETWLYSAANVDWANSVCDQLAKTVSSEHAEIVRKNMNGLRIRPFEVAGAAQLGSKKWPADFECVQAPAELLKNELNTLCPQS